MFMKKIYCIILFALISADLFGQDRLTLTESTKAIFDASQKKEIQFYKNGKIIKDSTAIVIKTSRGNILTFEDDLSDENFQTHEYIGDLIKDKIAIIKMQDYHTDTFITINLSTGDRADLIGYPHMLDDQVICLQGKHTDVKQKIEWWKIELDQLALVKSFFLHDEISPTDIAWKDSSTIMVEDSKGKFWEAKLY
jgi:hypothetical protein